MTTNPYSAPAAPVADPVQSPQGNFVPGGRGVAAGRGWRWIVEGWALFKVQPLMWMLVVLVLFLVLTVLNFIPVLGPIANSVLWPVFNAGLMIGCQAIVQGDRLGPGHVFAGFRERLGTLAGVGAVTLGVSVAIVLVVALAMGVGMGTLFGAVQPQGPEAMMTGVLVGLIVMALMLPLFMAIWFASPLVVFHERGVLEAMKESFQGCLRNVVPFLVYGLVGGVFAALAGVSFVAGVTSMTQEGMGSAAGIALIALPVLLGWLVIGPVFLASIYASYRDIYFRP